jgi:hypothetical protein
MEKEIWIDVIGYKGLYQCSNLGTIKSIDRIITTKSGNRRYKSTVIKGDYSKDNYIRVNLSKGGVIKTFLVHRLIYCSFYGNTPLVIDHKKEGNQSDNRLCNLQAITQQENILKHKKYIGKNPHPGVYWFKNTNRWRVQIRINGIKIHLGYFKKLIDAKLAYVKAKDKSNL